MAELKKRTSIFDFFSGLDYATIIPAVIASAYGLMLVYSATYSSLNGKKISSSLLAMFITGCRRHRGGNNSFANKL